MSQGLLDFQYEAAERGAAATALAGFGDLPGPAGAGPRGAGSASSSVAGEQGWLDVQMLVTVLALNLVGGDRVADVERLSRDRGFAALLGSAEKGLLRRRERRALGLRFGVAGERQLPSATALRDWLEKFHDPVAETGRVAGKAIIPAAPAGLRGLRAINRGVLGFLQGHRPADAGNTGHGRHPDRDPQASGVSLLQEVPGLPAAELLVGGSRE